MYNMSKTVKTRGKAILLWMSEEERESYKSEAGKLGISVADFIRLLFKQWMDGITFKKDKSKEKKDAS